MEYKLKEAHKIFGMETEAGRMLFKLYNKEKVKIKYPAIKTKKRVVE